MSRPSSDSLVVVVTGASSGIGRATAHAFARRGARVVLAARREEMLREVERECAELGGTGLAVPTDVTHEDEVERLAATAVERFGRIDAWFNNAGVGVFGRFEDIPSDVWLRVIETNLFGYMFGAKAAMKQFRLQGHGTLINNASIVGRLAKPDSSAYATSKFAIRGLSEALRQETLDDPDIHVCTILPSVIDTPFFHHAANFSNHRVRAAPPVYTPEKVADVVAGLVDKPRREVIIGGAGKGAAALQHAIPDRLMSRLNGRLLHRGFLADEPGPLTTGTLFSPMRDGRGVRGGWREGVNDGGVPTLALILLAAPVAMLAWYYRRR